MFSARLPAFDLRDGRPSGQLNNEHLAVARALARWQSKPMDWKLILLVVVIVLLAWLIRLVYHVGEAINRLYALLKQDQR